MVYIGSITKLKRYLAHYGIDDSDLKAAAAKLNQKRYYVAPCVFASN